MAPQPLGDSLGRRKKAEQQRNHQVAGQKQNPPVQDPQQQEHGATGLFAIQHLAACQAHPPQPGGGPPEDSLAQALMKIPL